MSQLKISELTLAYDGKAVVKELSFELDKGEYLCVVGENGSGKSTLIKSILGLVKPIKGQIILKDGAERGSIGYLPQQQSAQRDFPASVKEVVMSAFAGSTRLPFYARALKQRAKKNMELLNISALADRCYRELSGGQQQRVLLARALCATESMLLLDEPVNGLDPNAAKEMYSVIDSLHSQGLTVVMITHDVKSAVERAGKILHLSHDSFWFGSTADYVLTDLGKKFIKGGAV